MSGTLYLVATPIGNLGDVTLRALQVLGSVTVVACEDTRHSRVLLEKHGIGTKVISLPAFDEKRRAGGIVERLLAGQDVAVVTDAGMPGISDPGAALVALAVEAGVPVVPVPGPSASLAALAASGLPTDRFAFWGFLPRKGGARTSAVAAIAAFPGTSILHESPRRLGATLQDLARDLGPRQAAVARELTKIHEEIVRGTLAELADRFSGDVLGEITVVIGAGHERQETADPDALLEERLAAGDSTRDAAREVAAALGLPRQEVYRRALELAGKSRQGSS